MSQHVLLTGITGFIAKRIALDLLNDGYTVTGSLRSMDRADEVRNAVRPHLTPDINLSEALRFVELDLTRDEGWDMAMTGIDAVIHTASPFPMASPKDENEVIRPAVDGAIRALRAAQRAGVTRVVLTSSLVAIMHLDKASKQRDESDWTDVHHAQAQSAYVKSKTLAEEAAWNFAKEHPEIKLTAVNPGLVLGQPLDRHYGTSLALIERFVSGKDPAVPNFGFPVVDIKDISRMHVRALERPGTIGKRYIGADQFLMAPEMTRIMKDAFPRQKIPTRVAPNFLLRILAIFDPALKGQLPNLDQRLEIQNARAREDLGIDFIPAKDSIIAATEFVLNA